MVIFKIFGVIGLILISTGVLINKRRYQDEFYIIGGIFLLTYSISIKDFIFIILQIIFIVTAIYDIAKRKLGKNS